MILKLFMERKKKKYLLKIDEKYFETWYFYIIPFSFGMYWVNGFPGIPAYFTTWGFGIIFLIYGLIISGRSFRRPRLP